MISRPVAGQTFGYMCIAVIGEDESGIIFAYAHSRCNY